MQKLLRHRVLSDREVIEFLRRMEKGDSYARHMLIIHHQRFVAHLARKFRNTGIPFQDLFSIGTIGLIKGIDSFDPKKGQITTYVGRCIKNEILLFIRNHKKIIKEVSLDHVIDVDSEGNEITFLDMLSAKDDTSCDVEAKLENESVHNLIDRLSDKEKMIIELYFGLNGKEAHTQKEIGKITRRSQALISRTLKKILRKMREMLPD